MINLPSTSSALSELRYRLETAQSKLNAVLNVYGDAAPAMLRAIREARMAIGEAIAIVTVRPDVAEPVAERHLQAAE